MPRAIVSAYKRMFRAETSSTWATCSLVALNLYVANCSATTLSAGPRVGTAAAAMSLVSSPAASAMDAKTCSPPAAAEAVSAALIFASKGRTPVRRICAPSSSVTNASLAIT